MTLTAEELLKRVKGEPAETDGELVRAIRTVARRSAAFAAGQESAPPGEVHFADRFETQLVFGDLEIDPDELEAALAIMAGWAIFAVARNGAPLAEVAKGIYLEGLTTGLILARQRGQAK